MDTTRSALVFGGCGFIGFHLVRKLLNDPMYRQVFAASRNPMENRLEHGIYHTVDISNRSAVTALIRETQPDVIFHAACPSAITGDSNDYHQVTVQGTRNVLEAAKESPHVQVLIFLSSSTMAAGREHINLNEDTPLADTVSGSPEYARTKAIADKMVLNADTSSVSKNTKDFQGSLSTGCIRLPIVYGTHDKVAIPGALAALMKKQTNFQLGDGMNLWDFASTENAVNACILLSQALVKCSSAGPKVGGEAFNINDGQPHLFWDYARLIWKFAGHDNSNEKIFKLPTWLALSIAIFLEWTFWVFTLGRKRPGMMGMQQVEYSCFTHTYSIEKARQRLNYIPTGDFDNAMREAVLWNLNENGWSTKLQFDTKKG